ncbi:hypothetical protein HFN89_05045 [Rhizobium laguerreae]|nr:hypothetical protein [Rhizobium laguerreae]
MGQAKRRGSFKARRREAVSQGVKARYDAATCEVIIACRLGDDISAIPELRLNAPDLNIYMDEWLASSDDFFVYAMDREAIELKHHGVKDLDTLTKIFLPDLFENDLKAEWYSFCIVVGATDAIKYEILDCVDRLQPYPGDLRNSGQFVFMKKQVAAD